jgi:hypothetical protein
VGVGLGGTGTNIVKIPSLQGPYLGGVPNNSQLERLGGIFVLKSVTETVLGRLISQKNSLPVSGSSGPPGSRNPLLLAPQPLSTAQAHGRKIQHF